MLIDQKPHVPPPARRVCAASCMSRDSPPITQRTSGLVDCARRCRRGGAYIRSAGKSGQHHVECAYILISGGIAMKKHAFLAPLAASVAVLLANTALPAHAAIDAANSVATPETSSAPTADFVLTRGTAGNIQTADHESHASHESHSSHSSHASGS